MVLTRSRIPELDGLRALAIILVVAYHFDLGLPGGFLGVDLFFAVSGFVIARQLLLTASSLGDAPDGVKGALQTFYRRRALRLLPNALVMCGIVVVLSAIRPSVFGSFDRNFENAVAGLAGIGNWYAVRFPDVGVNEVRPLIHTWSLSIEEQFYLVLPVLVLVARRKAKLAALAFGSVAVLSSMWSATTERSATTAFFSTWSRAAPIGLGVLLAVLYAHGSPNAAIARWRGQSPTLMLFLGALFACAALVHWDDPQLRSGGFVLSALVCAGIVGLCAPGTPSVVGSVLRSSVMQGIGARSYAIYLWHFPVAYMFIGLGRIPQLLLRIVLAAALSEASYRLVELPLRRTRRIPKAYFSPVLMGAVALLLFVRESGNRG